MADNPADNPLDLIDKNDRRFLERGAARAGSTAAHVAAAIIDRWCSYVRLERRAPDGGGAADFDAAAKRLSRRNGKPGGAA